MTCMNDWMKEIVKDKRNNQSLNEWHDWLKETVKDKRNNQSFNEWHDWLNEGNSIDWMKETAMTREITNLSNLWINEWYMNAQDINWSINVYNHSCMSFLSFLSLPPPRPVESTRREWHEWQEWQEWHAWQLSSRSCPPTRTKRCAICSCPRDACATTVREWTQSWDLSCVSLPLFYILYQF